MADSKIIVQSNALTSSRFEYTALERNIFYSVLGKLSKEPKHKYVISVDEIAKATGVNNAYQAYMLATKDVMGRIYEIEEPNGVLQVAMFSHCRYIKGSGMIEVGISPEIHPYLFDLKTNFVKFQLEVALALSSKYSKRLYEILSQWATFNGGVKTFELTEIMRQLNLYDPKTKKAKYTWSEFERSVLKVAQKDLAKKDVATNIKFTYEGHKQGRKYTAVTFTIKQRSFQTKLDLGSERPKQVAYLLNEFKLYRTQVQYVLKAFSEPELWVIIKEMRIDIRDNPKRSVGAYVAARLGVKHINS